MSTLMEEDIKRWTAKRKTALVLDIIQGKTTVSEASRAYDLNPSEVEQWVDEDKRGMENALRSKPLEIKEQYERQITDLQQAYGEAMSLSQPRSQILFRRMVSLCQQFSQAIQDQHHERRGIPAFFE
jgi:transposase-like protein